MGGKRTILVADFETTTDPDDCRVWCYGWVDIETPEPEHVTTGLDIDEFVHDIQQQESICYFHNLKFDGTFILYWLLTNGYTHTTERFKIAREQFTTIISDMGMFYSITVRWGNGKTTEFRDSHKKLHLSVANVARAYKLPKLKGEIDYEKPREPGYEPTDDEWEYVKDDVSIIAYAMKQLYDVGATRLTIGSDSLQEFKTITKNFSQYFPVFDETLDADIRRAYRGGFTYADPRFTGRIVGKGMSLDVNSLYPSMMVRRPLPYAEPQWFDGEPQYNPRRPLTVFTVTFTARLKRDHIPCIQIKNSSRFVETEYLREIIEPTTLTVTNVDWELYREHYHIDVIDYHGGWAFKATTGIFDEYVDKWTEVKESSEGGMREIAKLHLNSLYGKFASRPDVTSKIPVLDDGVIRLRLGEEETRDPIYTAVGVFITSWARDLTIRSAQQNYDVFAYADTDSLHLLTDTIPEHLELDQKRMGAWAHEYDFKKAFYIRPKAYLEQKLDGTYVNRIAGLPTHISAALTFDDLRDGLEIEGKMTARNVPGGVVLMDTPYLLKL